MPDKAPYVYTCTWAYGNPQNAVLVTKWYPASSPTGRYIANLSAR